MEVSEVLEAKREERGISIAELSRRAGVKYDTLHRTLRGPGFIKGDDFVRICKELGIEIADFDDFS